MTSANRIGLSPKATTHLADLVARRDAAMEEIGLFVTNCAIALDIEAAEYAFSIDDAAFVRLLPAPDFTGEGAHGEIVIDESMCVDWEVVDDAQIEYCGAV